MIYSNFPLAADDVIDIILDKRHFIVSALVRQQAAIQHPRGPNQSDVKVYDLGV